MKKFLLSAAIILTLMSPVMAANEFVGTTLQELQNDNKNSEDVVIRKITDDEKKALEANSGPQPRKGEPYVVTDSKMTMVMIIRDNIVVFNSNPFDYKIWLGITKPGNGI